MAGRRRFCRDVALFAFAASCGVPACARPDNAYQVEFPTSPGSPGRAASTIDDRIKAVVRFEACGDELVFYRRALESDVSEEILEKIIAKMMWASGGLGPNSPQLFPFECTSHVRIMGTDFKKASDYKPDDHPKLLDTDASDLMQNRGANLNAEMSAFYGGSCPNMITEVHTPSADEIEVTFRLTAGCMRSQVNTALKRMASSRTARVQRSPLQCGRLGYGWRVGR